MSKFTDQWGAFTAIPNTFITNSERLSDHARWLFVLLRFHTHQETECAWPSYSRLQELTAWSRATISKAIKELEEYGWLERHKRFGKPVIYVLKRRSSSQNELLDDNGLSASSSDPTVVHRMNHSSSQNELQKFKPRTTVSHVTEQDRSNKKEGTRREGAVAPHAENKSRRSQGVAKDSNQSATNSPQAKSPKQTKDRAPKSPAIEAIREITKRYPPKDLWQRIEKFLGERFDREGLRNCYETWIARDYKPTNYDGWLFDWYLNGIPKQGGEGNGKYPTRKSEGDKLRDAAAYVRGY